jgi:hypothetical protein
MSITLAIVGTTNHSLMKFAIEKTKKAIPYNCIKIFSDKDLEVQGSEFYQLKPEFNRNDYSIFMMKELANFIKTDHVIVLQYDGFGVNSEYWEDKFLEYDYIGSPTHIHHPPMRGLLEGTRASYSYNTKWYSLGGGFSLRSRKFLDALQDPIVDVEFFDYNTKTLGICEDASVAVLHKNFLEQKYNIKYGSIEDSLKFNSEILTGYNFCVGFHGWEQIPIFLSEEECIYYIDEHIKFEKNIQNINQHRLRVFLGNCVIKRYIKVINHLKNLYNVTI